MLRCAVPRTYSPKVVEYCGVVCYQIEGKHFPKDQADMAGRSQYTVCGNVLRIDDYDSYRLAVIARMLPS